MLAVGDHNDITSDDSSSLDGWAVVIRLFAIISDAEAGE